MLVLRSIERKFNNSCKFFCTKLFFFISEFLHMTSYEESFSFTLLSLLTFSYSCKSPFFTFTKFLLHRIKSQKNKNFIMSVKVCLVTLTCTRIYLYEEYNKSLRFENWSPKKGQTFFLWVLNYLTFPFLSHIQLKNFFFSINSFSVFRQKKLFWFFF